MRKLQFVWVDDERCEIWVDGEYVETVTHDGLGWAGLEAVERILTRTAEIWGAEVSSEAL